MISIFIKIPKNIFSYNVSQDDANSTQGHSLLKHLEQGWVAFIQKADNGIYKW